MIPTRNTRVLTCRCLDSLRPAEDLEVLVVDDASDDGTRVEIERRFPGVQVLRFDRNVGFSAAVNAGLAAAGGAFLLLLNSDTEVPPSSWPALRGAFARRPSLGVVGGQLLFPGGEPQWSGGARPSPLWLFALASGLPRALAGLPGYRRLRTLRRRAGGSVDWVSGAAMAFRRSVWEQVGHFDEGYRFYCQDLDFCLRARQAGWEVAIAPDFRVVHHHGATIGAMAGAAGRQNPELLWTDLARWARRHLGEPGARRAVRALLWGGRLRVLCRAVGGLVRGHGSRSAWRRDTLSHRQALRALTESRAASPGEREPPPPPEPPDRP